MNKYKYTRKERIFKVYLKKINKKLWKILKPILIFILKLLGWIILLGIIFMLTSYDVYDNRPGFWLVCSLYFAIIINHYGENKSFKNWEYLAKDNEFYKRFCQEWHPHIFYPLLIFTLALKFCNAAGFIASFLFAYSFGLWDRRYITTNIKQDLILEKLNKINL